VSNPEDVFAPHAGETTSGLPPLQEGSVGGREGRIIHDGGQVFVVKSGGLNDGLAVK